MEINLSENTLQLKETGLKHKDNKMISNVLFSSKRQSTFQGIEVLETQGGVTVINSKLELCILKWKVM